MIKVPDSHFFVNTITTYTDSYVQIFIRVNGLSKEDDFVLILTFLFNRIVVWGKSNGETPI